MSLRADSSISTSLEWDAAAAPIPGETVLGDRAVAAIAGECALVAAIDGLGHGPEAAAAARQAASVLERSACQDPAATLRECHRALQATRGAAVSLATIQLRKREMTWLGVGNVEARLLRRTEPTTGGDSLLLHSGIVGHHLPRLSVQTMKIARGDLLIFATDGIQRDFADALVPSGSCRAIAERILHESAVGSDDALVLVVRYLPRA